MRTRRETNANKRKCETRSTTGSNDDDRRGKKETAYETMLRARGIHENTHTCARDERRRESSGREAQG